MKKKNKKSIFILSIIFIVAIIIIFIILNANKKELLFKCWSKKEQNKYFIGERIVNVYKKGKQTLFNDNIIIEKITDNEKVNNAIDSYFNSRYRYDEFTGNDFLTLNQEGKYLNLVLNINLTDYSKEEIEKIIGVSDISIPGLREFLELEGLTCEEY